MEETIRLSVRELVEFLLRCGSIDNRFGGFDRANEGSRIHRRLQKAEGPGYRPEVPLSLTVERGGFTYRVEGRADGILEDDQGVTIDEIKTTAYPAELLTETFSQAHWGQAMCYAHFWCTQQGLEQIAVRLTYFQVDTEEIRRFTRSYAAPELEAFFLDLLDQYERWARLERDWRETRGRSIKALAFPFAGYRRGQREMAAAVYRTIAASGRLFCQAPTGIGKTMSTLFPTVKAMGEGLVERIFYLTAKTITRQAAEEALERLRAGGMRLKSVTLTAKDKVCFLERRDCNPEVCPYAAGYYDRVNDVLYHLLLERETFTRDEIERAARLGTVCPFELALDLTLWCDAIIGDYNYLFDPVVSLKRFFTEKGHDYVFLIDEAHNLVDRSREMYSAQLDKSALLELRRKLAGEKFLVRALTRVNAALLELRRLCPEGGGPLVQTELPQDLADALAQFAGVCDEWLERNRQAAHRDDVLQTYFEVRFFMRIAELYDERFTTLVAPVQTSGAVVKLLCLDPSLLLDASMAHGRSSILFSATLSPADYFRSVLGGGESARQAQLPSPFEPSHLCLLAADHISTRYADRARSLRPIAELIATFAAAKPGNYLVFFPSYRYLGDVLEQFQELYPGMETLVQTGHLDESQREAFLARFAEGSAPVIGFCVLGGIFSEGIDLKGKRLIGAAVVGVGLPQLSAELDVLRDYYDRASGSGFDYAYRFPGMNKVQQAAGRVIRDEEDRGAVLLIDSRFGYGSYRGLFPPHWGHCRRVRGCGQLREELSRFWGEIGGM